MVEESLVSVCRQLGRSPVLMRFAQEEPDCERLAPFFHRADGIHGVAHTKRVLFWTLVLGEFERLHETDKSLLVAAAKYHDIGRINDWICEEHGFRSVTRMIEHKLVPLTEPGKLSVISFLIAHHCIDDKAARLCLEHASDIEDKENTWRLFQVFKDSDGLDRVRIRDLDVKYLRTDAAKKMKPAAIDLYRATEGRRLHLPVE